MNKVITIGREFGSGGREIGVHLAKKLNIPFYDKEIITKAANNGEWSTDFIAENEESNRMGGGGVITTGMGLITYYQQPISDQIFIAQSKVIKSMAANGPCVIIGRCADYVLQGQSINIFVRAELEERMRRKSKMGIGVPDDKMEKHILSIDKARKKYYENYTYYKWADMYKFNLCMDTTNVGIDGCVDTIINYVRDYK